MFKSMTTNLMVENVEASVGFYRDTIGFAMVDSVPNKQGGLQFAILVRDGLTLMVQERTNLIEEYPILVTDRVYPSVSLFIRVDGFGALYADLRTKCKVVAEPHTTFYGTHEFAVADVDGYVITFAESGDK